MVAVDLTLGSQIVAARLQSSTKWTRVHRRGLTNFTKGGQKGAGFRCPERARISWGKAIAGSGVRGTDLSRSGQRCIDTPCLRNVQLGGYRPGTHPFLVHFLGVCSQRQQFAHLFFGHFDHPPAHMCGNRRFRRPRDPGADLARDELRGPAVTSRAPRV